MRVAIFHGAHRPVSIECVEMPRPGPDDVLIKISRCGICGSDVSMTGSAAITYQPGPIGHEYAGEIVEVGHNVKTLRAGQRVACLPATGCGVCGGCKSGNATFCVAPRRAHNGTIGFGGFGEYITIPAGGAIALPESLSLGDGALIEPMACGLHALRMARIEKNAHILVIGAGSMALSVIFWARRLGAAKIIVASRSTRRSDVAQAMGADYFYSFAEADAPKLLELLGGGADIVVECVGKEGMLGRAIDYVRPQGTVISLGMCQTSEPFMAAAGTFKELKILFPLAYTLGEFIETANAFDADQIHPDLMVSDVITLEALPSTLESLRAGQWQGLKLHVDPFKGVS